LTVRASNGGSASRVVVHNLSATGLLIEADLALEVGDEFDVELPAAGTTRAEVVWRSDDFCGCEFVTPLSTATVSASRLRSMPVEQALPTPARMVPGDFGAISIEAVPNALTPRQKLLVIGSLALACWLPIILVVRAFF
jgi:hypothetical protein